MNNPQQIQLEIENYPELPVFPPGVPELLKALANDQINYAELAEELERFPSITIKVVATANSAWASPTIPITSLRDSCSRIGLMIVRSISISLSVSQVFDPAKCPPFNPKKFWISALLTAEAAYLSASKTSDVCPDTARLAGLLHNVGLLWLADKRPEETADAISQSQNNENISLSQALLENYNIDLNALSGHLASAIELPEIITQTIASNRMDICSENSTSMIDNHHYACQLASAVLRFTDGDNRTVNGDSNDTSNSPNFESDPCFNSLMNKIPNIQSMAQMLFSS